MINCCMIFLTAGQDPDLCMQSDIWYYNSAAMIKVVLEFKKLRAVEAACTICG